jgi:hypothetical protein
MAGNAWVLIPDEDPARFVPVSGRYPVERAVKPRPIVWLQRFMPPTGENA